MRLTLVRWFLLASVAAAAACAGDDDGGGGGGSGTGVVADAGSTTPPNAMIALRWIASAAGTNSYGLSALIVDLEIVNVGEAEPINAACGLFHIDFDGDGNYEESCSGTPDNGCTGLLTKGAKLRCWAAFQTYTPTRPPPSARLMYFDGDRRTVIAPAPP